MRTRTTVLSLSLLLGLAPGLAACVTEGEPEPGAGSTGGGKADDPIVDQCAPRGAIRISPEGPQFHDVALAGDQIVAVMTSPLTPTAAATSLVTCPLEGCPEEPTVLGKPGRNGRDAQVAATATHVYWTEKDLADPLDVESVKRANLDGSDARGIFGVFGPGGSFNPLAPLVASADQVVFAAWEDSNGPRLRTATAAATSTTAMTEIGRVQHPELAIGGGRIAMWDSIYGAAADLRKIRIYDATGALVTMTPRIEYLQQLAIDGDTLLYSARDAMAQPILYGCTTSDCAQPIDLGDVYDAAPWSFRLANGRAYFLGQLDNDCDANVNGWGFMSCETAALLDGTCTPEVHATGGIELLNIREIAVGERVAVFSEGLLGRLFRVDLATPE